MKIDLIFIVQLLDGLLMIAMPVGLAIYLTRRFHLGWRLWLIGAAVFLLSQAGHIPFNGLITPLFNQPEIVALPVMTQTWLKGIFLGLSAGLFEELFRYGMFRWWAKDARSWGKAVLTGAGHGGVEAIFLGIIVLYAFAQMVALRGADLSKLFTADQLTLAQQQVQGYWSMSPAVALVPALERFLTIPIQISMAVLVLQAFTRRQWFWVLLAVLYHALIDATAVIVPAYINGLWVEAFVAFFWIVSLAIIFTLRKPEPPEPEKPSEPPPQPVAIKPIEETKDNLDKTRYD
jgi:uncharacterized membrane protein YhfC